MGSILIVCSGQVWAKMTGPIFFVPVQPCPEVLKIVNINGNILQIYFIHNNF